jgi:hypothetical protein
VHVHITITKSLTTPILIPLTTPAPISLSPPPPPVYLDALSDTSTPHTVPTLRSFYLSTGVSVTSVSPQLSIGQVLTFHLAICEGCQGDSWQHTITGPDADAIKVRLPSTISTSCRQVGAAPFLHRDRNG